MKTRITLIIAAACLISASAAQAKYYVPKPHKACRIHYKRETVKIKKRVRRHHRWVIVRKHGKVVTVKQVRCVKITPKKTTKPTTTLPGPTVPAPTPNVRAGIDPSFTQDAGDNLHVTWQYSASAPVPLPDGTLSLGVSEPGKTGNSGGCSMNVGGDTTGGNCTVELSRYGDWSVTVSYASSDPTVAPATSTDTEDIEPLPATITKTWGTDAPTANPTVSATVIGSTAHVEVDDQNFEGASSLTVSDQNGDTCSATISGAQATCAMSLGANVTPSSFTLDYPGGASTQSTRPISPGGTQQVTTTWPAQTVPVTNPTVTVQQATVEECGGSQQGGPIWTNPSGTCSFGNPGTWSNPVETTAAHTIQLDAVTFGSLASDRDPTHGDGQVSGFLAFNIAGGTEGTDYTASDFQNGPDNSTDCSEVTTQSFDAGTGAYGPDEPTGTCALRFNTPGTYTVTVSYTSEDANYASVTDVDSETIDVQP